MQIVNTANTLDRNLQRLRQILANHPRLIVAYSGGVDSAFLAWMAHQTLGSQMLAVIADSPSLARTHLQEALAFARDHNIPVAVIETNELENPDYKRNDASRCFHCKDELFTVLERFRNDRAFDAIAYGVNADDQGDFRPGQQAAKQHSILAPLLEANLTKAQIRELAQHAQLRVWDKPASACLSSRIEYGRAVTIENLSQVESAEDALHALGFPQVRVRHHGDLARIEIAREDLSRALTLPMLDSITAALRGLGFLYITLDTQGYRSGSMNDVLPISAVTIAK